MDPINYMQGATNPYETALSGLSIGASLADAMGKAEAQKAAAEQERRIREKGDAIIANPNSTGEDYAKFALLLPKDKAESVLKAWDAVDKANLDAEVSRKAQVFSALASGQSEVAVDQMRSYAAAFRGRGQDAPAKYYETWAKVAEVNPDAARLNFGAVLATMPGGDKAIESVNKMAEEKRKADVYSPEQSKKEEQLKLDKYAADIGLAGAQKNKAIVEGRKLNAETAKILLDLEQQKKSGGADPAKAFDHENQLRKQYENLTAPVREVQASYQRILSAENTAAGDIALIFNYMKMLDPGSVVRESEFATAQNAAGIPDRVRNMYNKALSGERLAPEQRASFGSQAEKLFTGSKKQETEIRTGYERIAKNYGLNPDNLFYATSGPSKPAPEGTPRVAAEGSAPSADKTQALLSKYLK